MHRLITLLLLLCSTNLHAETLVVVGHKSPIDNLSEDEVSNIFLGKISYLKHVGRITPITLNEERHYYAFYKRISGKSPAQVNSYWTTLIFTGKGKPPKEIRSREELLQVLANNPGAVAFVPDSALHSNLKVVHTFH